MYYFYKFKLLNYFNTYVTGCNDIMMFIFDPFKSLYENKILKIP